MIPPVPLLCYVSTPDPTLPAAQPSIVPHPLVILQQPPTPSLVMVGTMMDSIPAVSVITDLSSR